MGTHPLSICLSPSHAVPPTPGIPSLFLALSPPAGTPPRYFQSEAELTRALVIGMTAGLILENIRTLRIMRYQASGHPLK
jgi:hypothetical protein